MENEIDFNAIPEIPHGHGLSFKKGVSDGLLANATDRNGYHDTIMQVINGVLRLVNT